MIILDTLKLALRALLRNRMRTFLTMLGIIIGISSVIIMMSLGSSLTSVMSDTFSSMGTNSISVSGKWEREGGYWRQLHEMDVADLAAPTFCGHKEPLPTELADALKGVKGKHRGATGLKGRTDGGSGTQEVYGHGGVVFLDGAEGVQGRRQGDLYPHSSSSFSCSTLPSRRMRRLKYSGCGLAYCSAS